MVGLDVGVPVRPAPEVSPGLVRAMETGFDVIGDGNGNLFCWSVSQRERIGLSGQDVYIDRYVDPLAYEISLSEFSNIEPLKIST